MSYYEGMQEKSQSLEKCTDNPNESLEGAKGPKPLTRGKKNQGN